MSWLTPDNFDEGFDTLRVVMLGAFASTLGLWDGAVADLLCIENWEQFGTKTPQECVDYFTIAFDNYVRSSMIGDVFTTVRATLPTYGLLCDGATYNRVDYPSLYEAIDPAFQIDADTFFVPDLRDRTIIGDGGAFTFATTGGETDHTLNTTEIPTHTHNVADLGHVHAEGIAVPSVALVGAIPSAFPAVGVTGVGFANISETPVGGSGSHNNMQPYQVLRYYIVAL